MWIFSEDGFFSTVVDRDDPTVLAVRSRDGRSLWNFCNTVGLRANDHVVETRDRDYPWRVRVPKQVWVRYMETKASELDYVDFKSHMTERWRVGEFQLKQLKTLGEIWALMHEHWEVLSMDDR